MPHGSKQRPVYDEGSWKENQQFLTVSLHGDKLYRGNTGHEYSCLYSRLGVSQL